MTDSTKPTLTASIQDFLNSRRIEKGINPSVSEQKQHGLTSFRECLTDVFTNVGEAPSVKSPEEISRLAGKVVQRLSVCREITSYDRAGGSRVGDGAPIRSVLTSEAANAPTEDYSTTSSKLEDSLLTLNQTHIGAVMQFPSSPSDMNLTNHYKLAGAKNQISAATIDLANFIKN